MYRIISNGVAKISAAAKKKYQWQISSMICVVWHNGMKHESRRSVTWYNVVASAWRHDKLWRRENNGESVAFFAHSEKSNAIFSVMAA